MQKPKSTYKHIQKQRLPCCYKSCTGLLYAKDIFLISQSPLLQLLQFLPSSIISPLPITDATKGGIKSYTSVLYRHWAKKEMKKVQDADLVTFIFIGNHFGNKPRLSVKSNSGTSNSWSRPISPSSATIQQDHEILNFASCSYSHISSKQNVFKCFECNQLVSLDSLEILTPIIEHRSFVSFQS